MNANIKSQIFRVARLGFLAAAGTVVAWVTGLHGLPTLASIEGAAVVAGEVAFRAVWPSVQSEIMTDLSTPKTAPAVVKVPPAVF